MILRSNCYSTDHAFSKAIPQFLDAPDGLPTRLVPSENKSKDNTDPHRREKRRERLLSSEILQIVHRLAVYLLRVSGGLIDLAARLRRGIAGQATGRILQLPADIAGCAFETVFVHFCIPLVERRCALDGKRRSSAYVPGR
jgi:hypothetical protein